MSSNIPFPVIQFYQYQLTYIQTETTVVRLSVTERPVTLTGRVVSQGITPNHGHNVSRHLPGNTLVTQSNYNLRLDRNLQFPICFQQIDNQELNVIINAIKKTIIHL